MSIPCNACAKVEFPTEYVEISIIITCLHMDTLLVDKDAELLKGKLCWQSIRSSSSVFDGQNLE